MRAAPQRRSAILAGVAVLVGRLHNTRWVHGALYPQHILITQTQTRPKAHLIDLEKAKYLGNRRADLARLWRHTDFVTPQERTEFESLYDAVTARRN